MKKIMIVFITAIIVGSVSVYASYKYFAKDINFVPNNTSWKVDNVGSALDDIYSNQLDTLVKKNDEISNQKLNISNMNNDITTLRSTISSKNSTIDEQETTIEQLTSTNTRLASQLEDLNSANCISGSYVFQSSCTTSTGCKLLDYEPSIFVLSIISGTTKNIWYYNKNVSAWYGVYGSTSSTKATKADINFSDRTNSSDGKFYFRNISSSWTGITGYYISCK